jgi:hypothetical protein
MRLAPQAARRCPDPAIFQFPPLSLFLRVSKVYGSITRDYQISRFPIRFYSYGVLFLDLGGHSTFDRKTL